MPPGPIHTLIEISLIFFGFFFERPDLSGKDVGSRLPEHFPVDNNYGCKAAGAETGELLDSDQSVFRSILIFFELQFPLYSVDQPLGPTHMASSSATGCYYVLASRLEMKLGIKRCNSEETARGDIKLIGKPIYCFLGHIAENFLRVLQKGNEVAFRFSKSKE